MKVVGRTTKKKAKANYTIKMETYILVIGRMIRKKVKVKCTIMKEGFILEIGRMIINMDKVNMFRISKLILVGGKII